MMLDLVVLERRDSVKRHSRGDIDINCKWIRYGISVSFTLERTSHELG